MTVKNKQKQLKASNRKYLQIISRLQLHIDKYNFESSD